MKAFLKETAEKIYRDYRGKFKDLLVLLPNRRASTFLKKHLSAIIEKPVWSPKMMSLEDFVAEHSTLKELDKIRLINKLFGVYKRVLPTEEEFEDFFFWGEMLLGDFDEIDRQMVSAKDLYTNLSRLKEINFSFDYLTREQREIIRKFWENIEQRQSSERDIFLKIWQSLFPIYSEFKKGLESEGFAYKGMLYQDTLKRLRAGEIQIKYACIIGFNALTTAESLLLQELVHKTGARLYWDLDAHYFDDKDHEGGYFLRENANKKEFEKSIHESKNSHLTKERNITAISVSGKTNQVKYLSQQLKALNVKGDPPENTVIVLPDEELLVPVLQNIPKEINKINVTMGYSLSGTALFGLIESLITLWYKVRHGTSVNFYTHEAVLQILQHQIIRMLQEPSVQVLIDEIHQKNRELIPETKLNSSDELPGMLFQRPNSTILALRQLSYIIEKLAIRLDSHLNSFDREVFIQAYQLINQLKDTIHEEKLEVTLLGLKELIRKVFSVARLPFSGEPLQGLQVMGVLETRNLDFENVFILSMNEDIFPRNNRHQSFIPFNIRRAYGLPTFIQQEAIYAYLFYRLIQRAKNVNLVYSAPNALEQIKERSRFIEQLVYDPLFEVKEKVLVGDISFLPVREITISRDEEVEKSLKKFLIDDQGFASRRLTPSAVNTYLDCKLRFYFRYIRGLYEYDEITDEIDPMVFGNLLHSTMEICYSTFLKKKNTQAITFADIRQLRSSVEEFVDQAFNKQYFVGSNEEYHYQGRNIIIKQLIMKFADKILVWDEAYAPFEILGLEADRDYQMDFPLKAGKVKVALKGIIDRIDRKGHVTRIIDYKTGKDSNEVRSVNSLVDRADDKRNKAAFQLLWYSLLFLNRYRDTDTLIEPGIFNSSQLFNPNFDSKLILGEGKDKSKLHDFKELSSEYEAALAGILQEIFFSDEPFSQTEDVKKCTFCPYKGICHK